MKYWLCVLAMAGLAWAQIPITGKWRHVEGGRISRLELRPDATGTLNGLPIQWTIRNGNELTLLGSDGSVRKATFQLTDVKLALLTGRTRTEFLREPETPAGRPPAPPCSTLVGAWRGADGAAIFHENGTATISGAAYRYTADATVITLTGGEGVVPVPYQLAGGVLTMMLRGKPVMLACAPQQQERNAAWAVLAGRWCRPDRPACFTLNPDGTYQYFSETATGPSVTTEQDSGAWMATPNSITMRSRETGAAKTYALERRNHPETKAPMLVLEGQPYLAYGPRAPW